MDKGGYIEAKSTYRAVEYIESSGAQYIDTGFKPNNNTRVVMDFQFVSAPTSDHAVIFGARDAANVNSFCVFYIKNGYFRSDYNTTNTNQWTINSTIRYTIDKNKETTSLDNTTQSYLATTFQCGYNMYLFALNTGGSLGFRSIGLKVYSCQIYDNGTLVRDFVPCLDDFGKAGLYDKENCVFYRNAGSGEFANGAETGEVFISQIVARTISKSYLGVTGIDRKAKKAYIEVNGVVREWFSSPVQIGSLPVGSSVLMNVNGVRTEFLVVHQGKPSSYSSSCDGTWLLTKAIYEATNFNETTALYTSSNIHAYLNGEFINLFDSNIKSIIKSVYIPCTASLNSNWSITTISAKVFLLSWTELGFYQDGYKYCPVEGSALDYFNGAENSKRIAYYNGNAQYYSTRTPYPWADNSGDYSVLAVDKYGRYCQWDKDLWAGIRPALILPSETLVDGASNVIA